MKSRTTLAAALATGLALTATSLTGTTSAGAATVRSTARATSVQTTNGCLTQRAGAGHHRAGQDLLLALPAGRRDAAAPGADDHAQPRLGRLPRRRPRRSFQELLDARVRRALLRPARLRRQRRPGARREPGVRGPGRPQARRPRQQAALGAAGRARATRASAAIGGSYGGGYQFLGAFEELRRQGQAGLRRARPRDHLVRPAPEPRPARRGAHRVGLRAQRRRRCRATRCRTRSTPGSREGAATGDVAGRRAPPAPRT